MLNKLLVSIPPLHTLDDVRSVLQKSLADLGDKLVKQLNTPPTFGGQRLQNIGQPQAPGDATTKDYVDQQIQIFTQSLQGSNTTTTSKGGAVQYTTNTATLALTTAVQDVPGATLTLASAGTYAITGIFRFTLSGTGDVGQAFEGALNVDGTDAPAGQAALVFAVGGAAGEQFMSPQQWTYTPTASGKVIKLRALKLGGTGASLVDRNTSLMAIKVA